MTYLRNVPYMGVIFVLDEAMKKGFHLGHPSWINLGQGQPEVGDMPGAPQRIASVDLEPTDHAYGLVNGNPVLREAVADYYNTRFRAGMKPYRASNVAIVQGGRLALSRALAALGDVNVGYMLPDYSAYEDMLGLHMSRITPIPVRPNDFRMSASQLDSLVSQAGVGAFLMSNPCNPTGAVVRGPELRDLLVSAKQHGVAMLMDEFYSHYIYDGNGPVSAASYVDNPDTDDVLIFDGLTKNFRYPGWRVGWVVGPSEAISVLDRVGSALDGGPSQVAQRIALKALEPSYVDHETGAVRAEFKRKRDLMVDALTDMGIKVSAPEGTFYVWGELPMDSMDFFYRALDQKVITVPGHLFDVNPGKRRQSSEYRNWMRFSFGPPYAAVVEGLNRLTKVM